MPHCEMIWSTAGTNRVCGRCLSLKDTVVGTTHCRCVIVYREVGSELLRPKPPPPLTYKPVSEERYQQLIIPLKKMGVTIHRSEEAERHLDFLGAEATNLGTHDVFFRQKVSVSAILEGTHHVKQNRRGMNDDKQEPLRSRLNEIDAKEYLLRVASKYGIPREEVEAAKIQLAQYKEALENFFGEKGGRDET